MSNLRDRGYPQSREYRENKSDKIYPAMTNDIAVELLKRSMDPEKVIKTTPTEDLLQRVVTAYNNKAFGTENAPLINYKNTFNDIDPQQMTNLSLWDRDQNRLGMLARYLRPDEASYDVAVDNGNPDRGVLDAVLKTPIGRFSSGYENETNYAGYATPNNEDYGFDLSYYDGGDSVPMDLNTGITRDDADKLNLYAFLKGVPIKNPSYNEIETPLGVIGYGKNLGEEANNGEIYGDFTPNDYIQALINLLGKKR